MKDNVLVLSDEKTNEIIGIFSSDKKLKKYVKFKDVKHYKVSEHVVNPKSSNSYYDDDDYDYHEASEGWYFNNGVSPANSNDKF